jgi:outer membrane protein TolC
LALEKRIQAQKSEVFREKSSILPRVSAFAELHEDSHDLRSGGESYVAGFRGSADLLDPTYLGRIKKAKAVLKKLEAEKIALRDSITGDLAGEFSRYEAVRSNIPVVRGMLKDAKEAVSSTEPLYREGRKDIAELLEIRKVYLAVGTQTDELLMRSEASYARLSFLAGGLDESEMREIAGRIGGDTQ